MKTVRLALLISVLTQAPVQAQIASSSARATIDKVEKAVINLRVSTSATYTMEGRELPAETREGKPMGLVINADGLVLTSIASLEPESMFDDFFTTEDAGIDDMKMDVKSEITSLKIRYRADLEVEADVALRDKELDLAFVRPKKKLDQPVPFVDLSNSLEAQLMDPVLVVSRLSEEMQYALKGDFDYVDCLLMKPRKVYSLAHGGSEGQLVLTGDGKVLGVSLSRKIKPTGEFGMTRMPIVLPASEILTVAKQIP